MSVHVRARHLTVSSWLCRRAQASLETDEGGEANESVRVAPISLSYQTGP